MSIRDDFFAAKAKGSLWDVAVSIKRGNPLPIDADSVFESYSALEAYASDVLAYPGQVVAVVNEDSTEIYYLDQNRAIQPVGVIPVGGEAISVENGEISAIVDGKSIEIADNALTLAGFSEAGTLTLPQKQSDGSISWVAIDAIVEGDGNTQYTFTEQTEESEVFFDVQSSDEESAERIHLDAYSKSEVDAKFEALPEDKDTTYSVKSGEKVLKLEGTEFSTVMGLKYVSATETEAAKIQLVGADNVLVSEIDATPFIKDGMLEDVEYNADNNTLTFTWNTDSGSKTDTVVLSDIIEPYTAGAGLSLTSNQFSVKVDEDSEFLSVSDAGLKLTGVSTAIAEAEGRAAQDATTKASQALADAKADAANVYATKEYVGTIPDNYTETNLISFINKKAEETLAAAQGGSSETAASVKQQLDNYKSENDTKVNANTESITTINEKLATIEENAEVNIIEVVKVNGTALTVNSEERSVDVTVPTSITTMDGYSEIDGRITTAKNQADAGVSAANQAQAAAETNAENITNLGTRVGNLETTKQDHETRIINLEDADRQHATEYTTLKGIVDGHTTSIAEKAKQTDLNAVSAKVTANETAITTLNETTIPGINTEVGKKANAADVYTKIEVGTIAEGKTLVDMINDAKSEATYDDTAVKGLISAETTRATGVEQGLDARLQEVETFFTAVDNTEDVIDTLTEIVSYIESDKSGASTMAGNIQANTNAIAAINNEETGILAQAKEYTDEQIARLPVATAEALGLVKFDNTTIKMNKSNQLYVAEVSTDVLKQGTAILVLNGGTALS